MNRKFLTPCEIADELRISTRSVQRMISAGILKGITWKVGSRTEYRVYRDAFELWQRKHEVRKAG